MLISYGNLDKIQALNTVTGNQETPRMCRDWDHLID